MVSLRAIGSLVETLSTTSDGNSVVTGQVPCLLRQTRVRLPYLGRDVVGRVGSCVEGIVGTGNDNRARSWVDIPSSGRGAITDLERGATGNLDTGRGSQASVGSV